MTQNGIEIIETLVYPALAKAFVYDVTQADALVLLRGGTIWARIKGESSAIHFVDLDTRTPKVVLGWSQ